MALKLIEHAPWMAQGDVFAALPLPVGVPGPALLLTHDCELDKIGRTNGAPQHLHFAPVLAVDEQDPQRQLLLRQDKDDGKPFNVLYLGGVDGWEGFINLNHTFALPTSDLSPQGLEVETGDPDDTYRVHPSGAMGSRYGTIGTSRVDVLHRKIALYWTRLDPAVEN